MLARRAYQNGHFKACQFVQAPQDFHILLLAFTETQARVDHDTAAFHAGAYRAMHRCVQLGSDADHGILQGRQFGPRFRHAAHMVDDQPGVGQHHLAREFGIDGKAAGIVHDIRAQFQGFFRHRRLIGVHRDRHRELIAQALQNRNQPPQLLGFGNARRTRPRRFRADVDDVRAFLFELNGAREGPVWILILAAIGKRIGGDVQNAQNESSLSQLDLPVANLPFKMLASHVVVPA